jgi:hypothetical protein
MNSSLSTFLTSVISTKYINGFYWVEVRSSAKTYAARHSTKAEAIADGIHQSCLWECYDRLIPTLLWDMKKGCIIAWNDSACNHPILNSLDGQCWDVAIGDAKITNTMKVERLSDDYFLVSVSDRPISIV